MDGRVLPGTYFYISLDSFVFFGGNILHNSRINCLKSWVRLRLFEGKSGANEQLIQMQGDYVLICKGDKGLIPLAHQYPIPSHLNYQFMKKTFTNVYWKY